MDASDASKGDELRWETYEVKCTPSIKEKVLTGVEPGFIAVSYTDVDTSGLIRPIPSSGWFSKYDPAQKTLGIDDIAPNSYLNTLGLGASYR